MALDYYRPNISGLTLYVESLAKGLAARGNSVTVLTHEHTADLPPEENDAGVRVIRSPVLARAGKALISPAILAAARRRTWTANDEGHKFAKPTGLALDRQRDILYVIDSGNNSVSRLNLSERKTP